MKNHQLLSIFRAKVMLAKYRDPKVEYFQGNPYIEALPPSWSKEVELEQARKLGVAVPRQLLKIAPVPPAENPHALPNFSEMFKQIREEKLKNE